jgi:dTMP kinase
MPSQHETPKILPPFLVFEGLDGSGKSTLIELIKSTLVATGHRVRLTREPGGTPLAEDIRRLLLRTDAEVPSAPTELLLYAASRAQHVACVIQPALASGSWVFCDRFIASSVAFQCFARGLKRSDVDWLNHFAQQGIRPSLTILLDLSVDESQKRQTKRYESGAAGAIDRMEKEAKEFHEAVRRGYLAQAAEAPEAWLVLDAMAKPEEMKNLVLEELKKRSWLKT